MADSPAAPAGPDFAHGVPLADIPEGGVLAGRVGDEPALFYKSGGKLFAVSGACTHYQGPLAEGLVHDGHVHCPWHHACFDLKTGEARAAPAFSPLKTWRVTIRNGVARAYGEGSEKPPKAKSKTGGPKRIVIVGGGAAGFAAAERLRRLGYTGKLTMLSADTRAPYDRPNLSKDYLAGTAEEAWMPLKDDAFYDEHKIELKLNDAVERIDVKSCEAVTSAGARYPYDALLLATGSEPTKLDLPGFNRAAVSTLRSMDDCEAIVARASKAKNAVVIGASFIGLETAASLRHRGLEVHVVAQETEPMAKIVGPQLAQRIVALHRSKGVVFHLERKPVGFDGHQVELDDGAKIDADLVVVGVGVKPRTRLAADAGLAVDNGVLVDAMLRTSRPEIFAAGDIAAYPDPHSGKPMRVEHWVTAARLGQIAAANMLGAATPVLEAPFFWSNHYEDLSIQYSGLAKDWDRLEVSGHAAVGDCTVRFFGDGRLLAAASVQRDLENLELAQQLRAKG